MKLNCIVCSLLTAGLILLSQGCGPRSVPPVTVTKSTCSVASDSGGSLITCPDGSSVQVNNGTPGLPGVNGTNGTNATPVTTVQFCPGSTNYPSTFLEYGICLNNEIYGVYSVNGGFLALLPPGAYNSNAVGSTCNFTILPNCGIQD
jgi:hypothetical protein